MSDMCAHTFLKSLMEANTSRSTLLEVSLINMCVLAKLVHRKLSDFQREPKEVLKVTSYPSSRDNTSFTLFPVHQNELTVTPSPNTRTHTY